MKTASDKGLSASVAGGHASDDSVKGNIERTDDAAVDDLPGVGAEEVGGVNRETDGTICDVMQSRKEDLQDCNTANMESSCTMELKHSREQPLHEPGNDAEQLRLLTSYVQEVCAIHY